MDELYKRIYEVLCEVMSKYSLNVGEVEACVLECLAETDWRDYGPEDEA